MKYSLQRWTVGVAIFFAGGIILAFCVFSNSEKVYRTYNVTDLPFVYEINENTDSTYFEGIHAGATAWNVIPASYFDFEYGGTTTSSSVANNNINLVYFDDGEGGNFDEGTNVIAFSLTFTSTAGGYHATESDLIWNSREFPPGTNGQSNLIDLQSTISHELGHHMGLGHFTEFGSPPGCGEEIPDATMAGGVAPGDTTRRSLHAHDIAASIELYPEWQLSFAITDDSTGNPVQYAQIKLDSAQGFYTTDPEVISSGWSIRNCPGYIIEDSILADQFGERVFTVNDSAFSVYVTAFGYETDTIDVQFSPGDAIPGTELQHFDVELKQAEWQEITVSIRDSSTQDLIHGRAEFYGVDDPSPGVTRVVELNTLYEEQVIIPAGYYDVYVTAEYPYAATWFDSVQVSPEITFPFDLTPAQILAVSGARDSRSGEIYLSMFDSLGYRYHHWDVSMHGDSLPPPEKFPQFQQPMKLFVFSEFENGEYLNEQWHDYLRENMDDVGNVLLAGNKIMGSLFQTPLLNDDLGLEYVGTTNKFRLLSNADDEITDRWEWVVLSEENATNQVVLDTLPGYPNTVSMDYENSGGIGLVYHETDSLKVVVVPFSLYDVIQFSSIMLSRGQLMSRINDYLVPNTNTGIADKQLAQLPEKFTVHQNYPNPFNPSTTITWSLPAPAEVSARIYNIRGQAVLEKSFGQQQAGSHSWVWNGKNRYNQPLSSGVYWLMLSNGNKSKIQKMILLR